MGQITEAKRRFHYCVLYTQTLKQWTVAEMIRKSLPEGRGTVFYPCTELWWHGTGGTVIRPLFPGYVFIRSDMEVAELHEIIRKRRGDILSFIKELGISERKISGESAFGEGAADNGEDSKTGGCLIDLKDDEAEFLDFMLNFRYEDGEEKENGEDRADSIAKKQPDGIYDAENRSDVLADGNVKKRPGGIPDIGVLRMSYGYREGKKYVVMKGPLKGYEDHIVGVNLRDRKAYLDLEINGHAAKAGLEIRGKRYWFPKDEHASEVLDDGTEIDLASIAKKMMSSK